MMVNGGLDNINEEGKRVRGTTIVEHEELLQQEDDTNKSCTKTELNLSLLRKPRCQKKARIRFVI